ncbi:MAG: hypothetical protein ACQESF_04370 [Nanobdellota archaeon]
MKKSIWLLFLIILTGCMQQGIDNKSNYENDIENIEIANFTTDNNVYGSKQKIRAVAVVKSSDNIKLKTRFHGIQPYRFPHIEQLKAVNLTAGENKINFTATTPYCTSGCGGVYPGYYQVSVELINKTGLLASKNISIRLTG